MSSACSGELGVQQRAEAKREAEQQPLDELVALISRTDAQRGDAWQVAPETSATASVAATAKNRQLRLSWRAQKRAAQC